MNEFEKLQSRDYLSKETTISLKGLFAIILVAVHLRATFEWMDETIIGQIFTVGGYLSVAVFFFFSGFGVVTQYKLKGELYILGFPRNRILDLYLKYVVLIIIYSVYNFFFCKESVEITLLIKSFFFGDTIVANGWYIQVILIAYIIFYFIGSIDVKNVNLLTSCWILSFVVYLVVSNIIGLSSLWYESFFAFYMGILWGYCKEYIDYFLGNKIIYIILLICSIIVFSITLLLGNLNLLPLFFSTASKMISACAFVLVLVMLIRTINVENRFLLWIGGISFEIYAVHGLILEWLQDEHVYVNDLIYVIEAYALTFITAILLKILFNKISRITKC